MNTQETLYGLMRLAKEQQSAVTQALEALSGEREALREERRAWAQAVHEQNATETLSLTAREAREQLEATVRSLSAERTALVSSRETLNQTHKNILQGVRESAEKGTDSAVKSVLAEWENRGAQALENSVAPFLVRTGVLAGEAEKAAQQLAQAGKWFTWKWALLAFVLMAGLVTSSTTVLYWQGIKLDAMERNMSLLKAKGANLTLSTCGSKAEVCVAVDESKGTYESRDKKNIYMISK